MDKEKIIKKEIARLKKIFKDLPEEKYKLAENLIQNIAFMKITLLELQQDILINGAVEEYKNGENQHGRKVSSASQVYNSMIKNYTTCFKALVDLLPRDEKEKLVDDGFDQFLKSR